jgi:HSP20 family protein
MRRCVAAGNGIDLRQLLAAKETPNNGQGGTLLAGKEVQMAKNNVPVKPQREKEIAYSFYPFGSLREELNRVFDDFFGDPFFAPFSRFRSEPLLGRAGAMVGPRVDISETETEIKMTAELPGLDEDDIELVLSDGVLTIKGEKRYEHEDEKENIHVMERRYGAFNRSFAVPDYVDEDKIEGKFDKGVLTITMPRRPETTKAERKIKIKKS